MADLYTRIRRRFIATMKDLRSDLLFSPKLAVARIINNLCGRVGVQSAAERAARWKDAYIRTYLSEKFMPMLEVYAHDDDAGTYSPDAPIWVCWWTGEETAPPLVQRCICSIRENRSKHPVCLITKENYREYLEIPAFMLQKVEEEQMGLAHLADYIRVRLLADYGGLWLDATIFCSDQVPQDCFDIPFFTCKSPRKFCGYISEMRWVTFCLGGWKGNVVYRFLAEAIERYWREESSAIDYLFFDYIIEFAYEHLSHVRELMNAVPENNLHRDDLQAAMNAALPASEMDSILHPDTKLYKLSWRESYASVSASGEQSIYSYFINKKG